MRLTTLVLKNIARRRIRSALTVCGMAIAVSAVVALVGIADGFQHSFRELYEGQGVDIVVVRARAADRMTAELDQSLAPRIAGVPGIGAVEPVLLDAISLEDYGLYGIVVQGVEPAAVARREQTIVAGRALREGDTRHVMIGQILARNLDKQVGDRLEIYEDEAFEIVGIYDRHNIFENGAMVIPLEQLQALLGQQGQVTAFNVRLVPPSDAASTQAAVDAIDALGASLSALATKDYVATDTKIRAATAMAWSTSVIALIVGGIGMLNTMIVSVFERTAEIGILRAIGWRKRRIVEMILLEAGILSLAGAVFGTLIAFSMTYLLSRAPASSILVGPQIAPRVIVQGFAIALGIGLVGAVYPAFRAAHLLPTVALRNEG